MSFSGNSVRTMENHVMTGLTDPVTGDLLPPLRAIGTKTFERYGDMSSLRLREKQGGKQVPLLTSEQSEFRLTPHFHNTDPTMEGMRVHQFFLGPLELEGGVSLPFELYADLG
eukprot:GFYU01021813.1.p2 GENE.GFYU01021813.1~~GFYU01021813.1.p2  ORF type:complete len:113 (-),score=19.62 GFYU01021813.1:42-380(-)